MTLILLGILVASSCIMSPGHTSLLKSSHALPCNGLALLLAMPEVLHEAGTLKACTKQGTLPGQGTIF